AGDLIPAKPDRSLGDLQSRRPAAQQAAVATPPERHIVSPRTRLEILEVEAEDVVPFDDVRIALANQTSAFGQQRRLVESIAAEHVTKPRRVREGDRDDAIPGPGRGGELIVVGRDDLDVERQTSKISEVQCAEGGAPGGEQILVHRIRKE